MNNRNKSVLSFVIGLSLMVLIAPSIFAHCQIPCGIYNDEMRFQMIEEDIATVEKSMKQIQALSKASPVNYNQLVRWINNKEQHATYIQDIVNEYFLTQRIKPVVTSDEKAYQAYSRKVVVLHQILFYAMKTKQTTDLAHVEKLRALLQEFHDLYFGPKAAKHLEEHHK